MELFPNESPQKHSQKRSEEDAGGFLPPDALISRAILKLSTTGSVEQLETHPRQWESHQHCCWGNRSKKQEVEIKPRKERHFREDGATYLPGISFLCASLPNSYFSQKSVIGIQYWKRTGRLFYKQIWTGHAGRCWGRSRKQESRSGFIWRIERVRKTHSSGKCLTDSVSGDGGPGWVFLIRQQGPVVLKVYFPMTSKW